MEAAHPSVHQFTRLFDLPGFQAGMYPNKTAVNVYDGREWKSHSVQQLISDVNNMSVWLINQQLGKGDKVVLVPHMGNYRWMVLDLACLQVGVITVPVHPTATSRERQLILEETGAKMCVTADSALHQSFKSTGTSSLVLHFQEGEENYLPVAGEAGSASMASLESVKNSIHEDDVASILYTSGSTGVPKGVMLTHRNIIHNIKAILTLMPLQPGDKVLSFLPFSHIFERATCYAYLAFGVSIHFSYSKESFTADFHSVKPLFCTCVPRVLEKMYDFMHEQTMHHHWLKRRVVRWAMETGSQYEGFLAARPWFMLKLLFARALVLRQWKKRLGGKIRYMAVGAASLRPDIGRLFTAAGIRVIEGYRMTETAPLISMNRYEPGQNRFGTVGLVIPGIEVKIDEPNEEGEGEILVKGPNVMMGYFNKPEITSAAITSDGWFHTGDVGKFVHKRFLQITDRKKDIFKTSAGKYIAPQVLQNHFTQSPFVQRCLAIGFQRPFVTALIVPHFDMLQSWCEENHIHWTAPEFMVHNIKVKGKMKEEIDRLNESLPNYERIRNFVLCEKEWTIEEGEITHTLKPVRHLLLEKYKKEIERMYA